jgi:hypothetical protein
MKYSHPYGFSIQDPVKGTGFYIKYYYSEVGTIEVNAPGTGTEYDTQAECEAAQTGASIIINHAGGAITLIFNDDPYYDNEPGSPNPTFCLRKD